MTRKVTVWYYTSASRTEASLELKDYNLVSNTSVPRSSSHLCVETFEIEGPRWTLYLATLHSEGHEILQQARSDDAQANDDS